MPSAAVSAFLSRFDKAKPAGGQWMVRCPAHNDGSPSLAVKEGTDGSVLLTCHAGCDTDRILSVMGLEASALFDADPAPKRTIHREYNYHDEHGQLLYQAIRYTPKGFSQRRPDPSAQGGWIYNLQGVRRIVYRLPELLGQKAILYVEGEKDADRAWELGIPATTSPMGAGKWTNEYAQQLQAQGIQRVAIIPDNDAVGAAHATTVTASLQAVGIEVRLVPLPGVPEHGDLSDYVAAGHGKEDLLALVKAAPIAEPTPSPVLAVDEPDKQFKPLGERRYQLAVRSAGIVLMADGVRRDRDGMSGELTVRVNGQFPQARTYRDGVLTIGDFNFTSVQARTTRAKLLADRAGDREFDWFGLLEEFVINVVTHEREGDPPVMLAGELDEITDDESKEFWDIEGFPLLCENPTVLFGDGASGKSYFALWLAGMLAIHYGIKVLYADWEFSLYEHRKRLHRLFQPPPKLIDYIRCEQPMAREASRLKRLIVDKGYQFLICDSIGFAVDGPAETHEAAAKYFAGLRTCGVGSLNLHHISKGAASGDSRDVTMFGSAYFRNGARSAWFIDRATENKQGELNVGLHHKKTNSSGLSKPLAYRFVFDRKRVRIERTDISQIEELASQLPLVDRLRRHMQDGELYAFKDLAEDLGLPADTIRKATIRSKYFSKIGRKVRLRADAQDTVEPSPEAGKVIHHEF